MGKALALPSDDTTDLDAAISRVEGAFSGLSISYGARIWTNYIASRT